MNIVRTNVERVFVINLWPEVAVSLEIRWTFGNFQKLFVYPFYKVIKNQIRRRLFYKRVYRRDFSIFFLNDPATIGDLKRIFSKS